jgi:hypothetical protein
MRIYHRCEMTVEIVRRDVDLERIGGGRLPPRHDSDSIQSR